MSSTKDTTFPRRDAEGRVVSRAELVAYAALGTLLGLVGVLVVDVLFALVGGGSFGQTSGWLAGVLPAMAFAQDVRAWGGVRYRLGLVLLCAVLALALGIAVAVPAGAVVPAVVSGGIGALVTGVTYAVLWYPGIRWLADRAGGGVRR